MGKPTGFIEYNRIENETIPVKKRLTGFSEFHTPLCKEERQKQASRCMNCGVPYCQSAMELQGMVTGCPLHNLIPEWNDSIYKGWDKEAYVRLSKTSPFPEFTSRVCPALCEKACLNGVDNQPVTIHDNEHYIIETAFKQGWVQPQVPTVRTNKKVAVVGSGPSGLSVASQLNHRGHDVTVFEREDAAGGLLMYGIPNMKLDKEIIQRRIRILKQEGITFHFNVNVGVDISKEELMKSYDAIVLCVGSKQPRNIAQNDGCVDGIYYAVDYLTQNTKHLLQDSSYIDTKNKNVIIVGGGDTGNDCTGTAIRQGCQSVTQLEMMPKPSVTRLDLNPWPEWPKVLKVDYGQEESIDVFKKDPRVYSTTIKNIYSQDGVITGVQTVQVQFNQGKLEEVSGSEKDLPCDVLLIAAGFTGVESYVKDAFQLDMSKRNTFQTQINQYHSSEEKIFVAGDSHRGQSLVVWAIYEGLMAAKEIDAYLMGYTNL